MQNNSDKFSRPSLPPSINLLPGALVLLLPHTRARTHTHTASTNQKRLPNTVPKIVSIVQSQIMIDSWLGVVVDIVCDPRR